MEYYPEEQLRKGEKIIAQASPTLFAHIKVIIVFGIILGIFTFGISTLLVLLYVYFQKRGQQVALTDKRVIGKYGLISRVVVDSPLSKLSSVRMRQSIFGRMFGFGTIELQGMGGDSVYIPGISKANEFRRIVSDCLDVG